MAGNDEPLPETTMRLIWKVKEAQEEEWRRRDEWIEHLNSMYVSAGEAEVGEISAYRLAQQMALLHERGELEEAHEDTPRLARAYLDAIQKRKDAMSITAAEFAVSHPEHLGELNRERSLEEMKQMLDELQGEENPPEPPPA